MKTAVLCLIAVLTSCAPSPVSRAEPEKERTIVVLNLASLGIPETRTDILSDTLRGEIERVLEKKRTLRYHILTSADVEKIVQESGIEKGTVFAVMDLEASGLSGIEKKMLSEKLRSSVSHEIDNGKSPYVLVERDRMDIVLQTLAGKNEGKSAIDYWKLLQADCILTGSVEKADGTYRTKVRIVDVESGKTVSSEEQGHTGRIDDVLVSVIPDMGRELVYGFER